jgi:hypothetical protein
MTNSKAYRAKLRKVEQAVNEALRDGWVYFKEWRVGEAMRLGYHETHIFDLIQKGHYPHLQIKRLSTRTVLVKPGKHHRIFHRNRP